MFLPCRAISPQDSDNPYAPPRADVGTPSVTDESEPEAVRRKSAALESFAKAVGMVCYIYAIFDGSLTVCHAGWGILASLGTSIPWPYRGSFVIIGVALGALVAATGLTAGYGLRQLRSWSSWTLRAFALAIIAQFVLLVFNDLESGHPDVAAMTLLIGAMPLVPVATLWRLDLGAVLSKDYAQVVADTPYIEVRAKLPIAVKCVMALVLLMLIGLAWSL
jgi:hypothetical protein